MVILDMIKDRRIQELVKIIKKNGWSKAKLSRVLNISYTQVNRYIAGTSVPGSLNNIEKIDKFITLHK